MSLTSFSILLDTTLPSYRPLLYYLTPGPHSNPSYKFPAFSLSNWKCCLCQFQKCVTIWSMKLTKKKMIFFFFLGGGGGGANIAISCIFIVSEREFNTGADKNSVFSLGFGNISKFPLGHFPCFPWAVGTCNTHRLKAVIVCGIEVVFHCGHSVGRNLLCGFRLLSKPISWAPHLTPYTGSSNNQVGLFSARGRGYPATRSSRP